MVKDHNPVSALCLEGDASIFDESDQGILNAIHEMASEFHEAGVFSKTTMRKYDRLCRPTVRAMTADEIREVRDKAGVSQAVLARIMNVTTNAVGQWERGEKRPSGAALKLLTLIRDKGIDWVL